MPEAGLFTNDYIMRQIELLILGIRRIIGLKQENRIEECTVLLTETLRRFFGLNDRSVETLPWRDLISVASLGGALDTERCMLLAQLVKEKADADGMHTGADQATLYEKAFCVYATAYLADEAIQTPEHASRIDELIPLARGAGYSEEAMRLLLAYEDRRGRFGRAEDRLFEWLDMPGDRTEAIWQGKAFYERLRGLPDEALRRGGLLLSEVEDGLRQLKRREPPADGEAHRDGSVVRDG